jgi:WD40 repeat protein
MDDRSQEADQSTAIHVGAGGRVGDITVQGDVAGRDIINITEELTYDVSDLHANPYVGLASYTYATRAFYGGRELQIDEAVERLTAPGDEPVLVFVTGASGSGKSSFAQAGLIPALEGAYARRGRGVKWSVIRPGRHPVEAIWAALREFGVPEPPDGRGSAVLRTPDDLNHLLATQTSAPQVNVLVLDQFEELFTQAEVAERDLACALLSGLDAFARLRTHIIATLRADYLPALFNYPALLERFKQDGIELRAMSPDELARAIRRPLLEQARLEGKVKRVDPGLVDRLVEDVGTEPGLLPLLQVTLRALWDEPPHVLALERYRSLTHALQQQANRLLDQDRQGHQRTSAERDQLLGIFLDLVEVSLDDDPRRDVRRTLPKEEVLEGRPERRKLVDELADARLLTTSVEQRQDASIEMVDIIHESLLDNWPRLREAITQHREALQQRERFRLSLREWLQNQPNQAYLLHGVRLAEARSLAERDDIALREPAARDLLRHSIERERWEQQRAARARLVVVLALLAIVTVGAVLALVQRQDALAGWAAAEQQRGIADEARSDAEQQAVIAREQARLAEERERAARLRELAAQSSAVLHQLPQRSLLLAVEAVRAMREAGLEIPAARDALRQAVLATGGATIATGDGRVSVSATSANGRWLAFGFEDGAVWLVDLSSPRPASNMIRLRSSGPPVAELAFAAADQRLLVTERYVETRDEHDRTLRLYAVASPDAAPILTAGDGEVFSSLAISPDGRWVATEGGQVPGIRLWDVTAPQVAPVGPLVAPAALHSLDPYGSEPVMRFSPNGRWLVAVGKDDRFARLWDLAGADPLTPTLLQGGDAAVVEHQGHVYVVTRPTEQRALIWDLDAPNPLASPVAVPDPLANVDKIRLSPDRRWLVTAVPRELQLWNVAVDAPSERPLLDLSTSADQIQMTPDSHWLWVVHSGQIGYARLSRWDLTQPDPAVTQTQQGVINGTTFWRSDGELAAASEGKGVFRAWNLDRATPTIYSGGDEVTPAESAADDFLFFRGPGQGLVTVQDAAIRIWPEPSFPGTEKPLATLRGHEGAIRAVTISPNYRWLATVGSDRTIRLWDLDQTVADLRPGTSTPVPPADELDDLIERACARAGRDLTTAEWREIFGDAPHRNTCTSLPPRS